MTTMRAAAALFAFLEIFLLAPLAAQPKPTLTLVGLAEIPRLLDPQLSPDGRFVAYTLMRADWKANRQVGHIWRQAVDGGAPIQMTKGDAGEANVRWSPDGRSLLFLAPGPPGGMQLFIVPAAGGEPRQLTRHATGVSLPTWSSDGSAVYFLAPDSRTSEEIERDRLRDDVYVFEENFKQRHLWKAAVASSTEQKITNGDFSILSYRLARDGRHTTAHRAPTPLIGDAYRGEIWMMDADGANARPLTNNDVEESESELSPDNAQVLFLAEAAAGRDGRLDPYYSSTLFLTPARGGAPRMLLRDFPYAIEHASWGADSRTILASVNMGVHSELFRIDVDKGEAKPLTEGQHSVQFWSAVPAAGRMVFQFDEPTRLGDAWTLGFDGGAAKRVTGVYDPLEREFALPRQEKVTWKSADRTTIEGLLFYPIGYQAGARYPLIVQLHGGPQESDKFGYGPGVIVNYVPVLAAKGYAVLRPNYRGSTGYGNAFLRDVVGSYFRNMPADVLTGLDALIARGIADPNRVAVMGWSAGGHLTNKLVTVTDRFKAASSTAGAANWTSLFAQTDTRTNRSLWFGGTPWQPNAPIDAYWNNSPLKDAAKVRTPTMFVVGQEDPRVPLAQSIEMYRALRSNGVPTRLIVAPREGHQWGELRHQIYKANAELEWFERYVMGRPYTWERPPADGS